MGMRRRTRRRALLAGAAVAHHQDRKAQEQADLQPSGDGQYQAQSAPPPVDMAAEIEHLAQLHASGALTDEEFAAAKAKALAS